MKFSLMVLLIGMFPNYVFLFGGAFLHCFMMTLTMNYSARKNCKIFLGWQKAGIRLSRGDICLPMPPHKMLVSISSHAHYICPEKSHTHPQDKSIHFQIFLVFALVEGQQKHVFLLNEKIMKPLISKKDWIEHLSFENASRLIKRQPSVKLLGRNH